jgi:hypothetical protein
MNLSSLSGLKDYSGRSCSSCAFRDKAVFRPESFDSEAGAMGRQHIWKMPTSVRRAILGHQHRRESNGL